ncbi:YopJ/AvrA family T3SS effector serine/threonine acetyltransferase [Bartonella sp. 220]|uniref:YopJ/AvrA family T3SS effector serine/threonine acetyltransferase n=1 Tax=Bartonella sp. 220B TaxID=2967260 RepID=UPI0022A8D7F4|nr:YopJ/AvrA family T3SS effector serine/threonine acetyltransferase [Bartonella sp. 220B]MCZ2158727.1 YopJ/AvrA family T3SS effector serine/threonine acetyltransferase [Bartonella sp. 220B]
MKPQGSKNTASAPLKGDVVFSHEELQNIITRLESDIISGYWMKAYYADTDLRLMPALVEQANKKYPEMNLQLAMTPESLTTLIKQTIDKGNQSSRFITNTGGSKIHFTVIDHHTIDGKTSLILFEPTTCEKMPAARLTLRIQTAVSDAQLPDCHFSIVEMDIQRSSSECGIFSLALAKKLHIESAKLARMHKDNISGVLCESNTPLPSQKLDTYLPANFYKHTQGRRRLREYIKSNPEAENEKVNKKGETLTKRFERNLMTTEKGKKVSVSPHIKRVTEYKSLMI